VAAVAVTRARTSSPAGEISSGRRPPRAAAFVGDEAGDGERPSPVAATTFADDEALVGGLGTGGAPSAGH
jgi:hypothetical protein